MPVVLAKVIDHNAFEPEQVAAISTAYEQACIALGVPAADKNGREAIASRIIDLARSGVIDIAALSSRVVVEARAMQSV